MKTTTETAVEAAFAAKRKHDAAADRLAGLRRELTDHEPKRQKIIDAPEGRQQRAQALWIHNAEREVLQSDISQAEQELAREETALREAVRAALGEVNPQAAEIQRAHEAAAARLRGVAGRGTVGDAAAIARAKEGSSSANDPGHLERALDYLAIWRDASERAKARVGALDQVADGLETTLAALRGEPVQ